MKMIGKYLCKIFGHPMRITDFYFDLTRCKRCGKMITPRKPSSLEKWIMVLLSDNIGAKGIYLLHQSYLKTEKDN